MSEDYTMVDLLNDEMKSLIDNLPKIIEELKSEISRLRQENETLYFEKENFKTYIQNHEEIWKRNAMIDNAELQKQVDELRSEKALFDLQLQFQIGEADIATQRAEQLEKEVEKLRKNRLVFVKPRDLNPQEMEAIEQLSRQFIIPVNDDVDSLTPVALFADLEKEAQKKLLLELKEFFIEQSSYGCDTNQHCGYYDYQVKMGEIIDSITEFAKQNYDIEV